MSGKLYLGFTLPLVYLFIKCYLYCLEIINKMFCSGQVIQNTVVRCSLVTCPTYLIIECQVDVLPHKVSVNNITARISCNVLNAPK
jgi:hypothetical protein